MILGERDIVESAVYQASVSLLVNDQESALSLGIECLWVSDADSDDKQWCGFRIIDISPDDRSLLAEVIEQLG